ncbi:hypothetical protein LCGC14_0234930 [marine sediment metagenome]|uniref:Uncharacterized protein n=1 Tax=marine sediment metagenome TaxID=412755 RepID=A0A0F9UQ46_9ZZZZ
MKIQLSPGNVLKVGFVTGDEREDGSLDGEFEIHFDTPEYPKRIVVKESAGFDGSEKGKANEVLYEEWFGKPILPQHM